MAQTTQTKAPTLRDRLGNGAFRAVMALALALPYRWRVPLTGWAVAYLVAPLAGYRDRVRDNLAQIRPDLPRAEVERLARAVPDNVGRTIAEIYSGEEFIDRVRSIPLEGPGAPALQAAQAAGRPVILA
ncbi:lauroyl acyltransferase, partial [Candidatus Falkowbacteria bacterium]|nr:lauroyl acyltransferase [Candidatus Falkowbacteria bacterium]